MKDDDKNRVTQAQAIRQITENWAAHMEGITLGARLTRAKYLALLKEGFTEAQAIELCKGG